MPQDYRVFPRVRTGYRALCDRAATCSGARSGSIYASVCERDPDRASAIVHVTASQLQTIFSALRLNLFESGFEV